MYEYITNDNGSVVGNYSLQLTVLNSNTVQGQLPSSFNAEQLLSDGSYTAVYTYYPTSNFTQPSPLTITFSITVCHCLADLYLHGVANPVLVHAEATALIDGMARIPREGQAWKDEHLSMQRGRASPMP